MGAIHSERVTFLTTPEGKAELVARASELGVSLGEFIRSAMEGKNAPDEEREEQQQLQELEMMVAELVSAIPEMKASLERSARKITDTNERVERKLQEAGIGL